MVKFGLMEKNNQYFFILGTNRTLTTLDILAVLKKQNIAFDVLESSDEVLIINTSNELNSKLLIEQLGSSQKIGEIYGNLSSEKFIDNFELEVGKKEFVDFLLPDSLDKLNFGISVYNLGGNFGKISHNLNDLCGLLKDKFKNDGKKAGYLMIKDRFLSTVAVEKEHLLDKGFELVLIVSSDKVYLGKTFAVQDFGSYSFRDYGRPARDSRAGMLPPKLAKMMINLSGIDKENILLDPFCGSGTILQEAILLGYKNILGSDKEEKAVGDANQNINWLFDNYKKLNRSDYKIEIIKAEAENLSDYYSPNSIDGIVTEPFLGDPRIKFFDENKVKKEVGFLEELYFQAFKEFKKVLKSGGKIVIILPVFNFPKNTFYLDLKRIEKMGFIARDFNQDEKTKSLNLDFSKRNSIIFSRPDQTILREIFVFSLQGEALLSDARPRLA